MISLVIKIFFFVMISILIIHIGIKHYLLDLPKTYKSKENRTTKKIKIPIIKKKKYLKPLPIIKKTLNKFDVKKNLIEYVNQYKHKKSNTDINTDLPDLSKFFEIQNDDIYMIPKDQAEPKSKNIMAFDSDNHFNESYASY